MLPSLKGGNLGDFQPGAASSVGQDGVFCNTPEHVLEFWSRNLRVFGFKGCFFFLRLEKQHNNIPHLSPVTRTHLTAWNKHKAHVCCIYLLLQPWVVPSEMLTRNKVHSFLSGHRMFPPQPREHFFGYLLGEAWHFHRDCNTETRGGWRRRSLQSPAPGRKRSSQSQIHGDSSHTAPQQLQPTGARAGSPHPLQAGLIALKEGWIPQHPSSGLFLCRAGVFQLKWGRFSYLGFPKELPRQRRAGKIHHNHRQQTGTGDQPSVP